MVRAIVWKEFREQGLIGLTLVVLGGGVLVAVAVLADPPQIGATPGDVFRALGPGPLATLLLAVTAGTVCGGALFAAEREAGTHGFLESLPARRSQLWTGKVLAGGLLVAAQAGAVIATGFGLGLLASAGWALAVGVYSFLAFCWGVLGSTLARTTLGSVGVAIPAATVAAVLFLVPVMIFFAVPNSPIPRPVGAVIFLVLMFVTPLAWSAVAYTRPDWVREADDRTTAARAVSPAAAPATAPAAPAAPRRPRLGLAAVLWLALRQLAGPGPVLAAFAVAAGLALLVPPTEAFVAWPALAVMAGVLAGVTAFADEQAGGAARFWGERRLPVGRMWLAKVAVHLAFALLLAALVAAPMAVRAMAGGGGMGRGGPDAVLSAVFRTLMFEPRLLGAEGWKYVLAPVGYGFAAGVVCGMLFKKPVVGAGVAGVTGGTGFALWLPSLLAGGVWHLWLWLPPAVALLAGRGAVRAWAAERVATRRGLTPLLAGAGGVAVVLAAGVGFRAVEVPDAGGATDDLSYVAGLITFEQNETGRTFRTAAEQFARVALHPNLAATAEKPAERVERFRQGGFRTDDPTLARWFAQVYELDRPGGVAAGPAAPPAPRELTWYGMAALAADPANPIGIFEHPQVTLSPAGTPTLETGRVMAAAAVVRGLFKQAEGDPAAFPDDLRTALAVGRTMRNGSIPASLARGNDLALYGTAAALAWLGRLDARPDLLRKALAELVRDERAVLTRVLADGTVTRAEYRAAGWGEPFDPTPHVLAERFVVREQLKAPTQWLPDMLAPGGKDRGEATNPAAEMVAFAWSVPWEKERTRRLVAFGLDPAHADAYRRLARGRPGAMLLAARPAAGTDPTAADLHLRVCRRAAAVALAARAYHADRGAFPPDFPALVAGGYLESAPPDPYSPVGAPLGYRLAGDGETLPAPPGPPPAAGARPGVALRPGQPVVWSVGPDRLDDGGRGHAYVIGEPVRSPDLVFVVPPSPANP